MSATSPDRTGERIYLDENVPRRVRGEEVRVGMSHRKTCTINHQTLDGINMVWGRTWVFGLKLHDPDLAAAPELVTPP